MKSKSKTEKELRLFQEQIADHSGEEIASLVIIEIRILSDEIKRLENLLDNIKTHIHEYEKP